MDRLLVRVAAVSALTLGLGCGKSDHKSVMKPEPAAPTPLARAKIVFLSDRDGQPDLYLLDPIDSSITRVTFDASAELYPAISPDSSWIAFMQTVGVHRDVFVVGVDGTQRRDVTNDPSADEGPPRWSPDGSWIYFTKAVPGSPTVVDVFKIRPDGTSTTPVTQDGATVLLDVRLGDGTVLAQRYTGLWTMGPAGGSQALIDTSEAYSAEFAPAGDRIAYSSSSPGGAKDVYVMDADGTHKGNVTNGLFDTSWSPTWSPDGNQIVFHASNNGAATDLYVVAPNGTALHPVTQSPSFDGEAYWGPK